MPKLVWTEEDERLIKSLVEEFEPTKHPLSSALTDYLPSGEWHRWVVELREYVKKTAQVCLSLRAITEGFSEQDISSIHKGEHPEVLRNAFLDVARRYEPVPDDITRHYDVPRTPDGEWSLQNGYIIEVGGEIEERLLGKDLFLEGAQS